MVLIISGVDKLKNIFYPIFKGGFYRIVCE